MSDFSKFLSLGQPVDLEKVSQDAGWNAGSSRPVTVETASREEIEAEAKDLADGFLTEEVEVPREVCLTCGHFKDLGEICPTCRTAGNRPGQLYEGVAIKKVEPREKKKSKKDLPGKGLFDVPEITPTPVAMTPTLKEKNGFTVIETEKSHPSIPAIFPGFILNFSGVELILDLPIDSIVKVDTKDGRFRISLGEIK